MTPISRAFDPWGPISSVLFEIKDSDFVQNAIASTGINIEWRPFSQADAYSHSTRIRALRRDISAAYASLEQDKKGLFAQIVVKSMLQRADGDDLRSKLADRLHDIGWTISQEGLIITEDALVREQFFPPNTEFDAYITIRDLLAAAQAEIAIVDAYISGGFLLTLRGLAPRNLVVKILTVERNLKPDFRIEVGTFGLQIRNIALEIRTTADFHDRFIVVDDSQFYHVGASLKNAGRRAFMLSQVEDAPNVENLRREIAKSWAGGTRFHP
jgi:hypothetical protein